MVRPVCLVVALMLGVLPVPGWAAEAEVLDAETLRVNGELYRLAGIDAPEAGQHCVLNGRLYPCGEIAKAGLMDLVAGASVTCRALAGSAAAGSGADGAVPAHCFSDGYDLSEGMAYTGWAMADPLDGEAYRALEADAAEAGRGLWRGSFVKPWDWRAGERLPEE